MIAGALVDVGAGEAVAGPPVVSSADEGTGLVRARRSGRMVLYSLADRHILELFDQGRRHVQEG